MSILTKLRERHTESQLIHPSEISLGIHLAALAKFSKCVARDLLPNRLTEYLYELAEKFNAFFRDCRVEGTPEEASRLLLCELTAKVLTQGLNILGLETVERMLAIGCPVELAAEMPRSTIKNRKQAQTCKFRLIG